jgi:PAS domain-containing protein
MPARTARPASPATELVMTDRMGQALSMQACFFSLPAQQARTCVVLRDVTQQKQELWLSTLLDNMDDGIIAMDMQGC